jgi:hypothetical protein
MRSIPENNLAYPALITLNNGSSGSGFQLTVGDRNFLVTAKHVLFDSSNNLLAKTARVYLQPINLLDPTFTILDYNLELLHNRGNILYHNDKDVAVVFTGNNIPKNGDNSITTIPLDAIVMIESSKSGNVFATLDSVRRLDDVLISNDVFVYGYPSSLGIKEGPQFNYYKPLLRKGIVANVYKELGTIILDCPVYPGNSGGPVVQVTQDEKGLQHSIIGIVSQFIPYSEKWKNLSNNIVHTEIFNSGYSVAVSIDYVLDLIK